MTRLAWTPATSDAEATRLPTGYVTAAPEGSHTDGRPLLATCTGPCTAQAVRAALATKLVFAIRSSPCILKWLLSGTTAKMKAHLVNIQLTARIKSGGATANVAPFKLASVNVPDSGVPEGLEAQRLCYPVHHACQCLTLALL